MSSLFSLFGKGEKNNPKEWITKLVEQEFNSHHRPYNEGDLTAVFLVVSSIYNAEGPGRNELEWVKQYGSVCVVPTLVAHAGNATSNTREMVISLLLKIEEPISSEVERFLVQSKNEGNIGYLYPKFGGSIGYSMDVYEYSRRTALEALRDRQSAGRKD